MLAPLAPSHSLAPSRARSAALTRLLAYSLPSTGEKDLRLWIECDAFILLQRIVEHRYVADGEEMDRDGGVHFTDCTQYTVYSA